MIAKNKNNQKNPVGQVTYYSTGLALLHLPFFPCERETEKTFTALHHGDISIAALRRVPGVELYSLYARTAPPGTSAGVPLWQAKLALYVGSQQAL
jgi:hypothetical protein